MNSLAIAFLGGGNMAEAIVAGLLNAGHKAACLHVCERNDERRVFLQQRYAGIIVSDAINTNADVLLLAVKPQQMLDAATGLGLDISDDATVISIAAGIECQQLQNILMAQVSLVRVMPNTPALLGAGMSVLFSNAADVHIKRAEYILSACGDVARVDDEQQMHAVTALSGSGPAYFFYLSECMQQAGITLGLDAELAAQLANQTAFGAGRMLAESDCDAAVLRQRVTSPAGTTQAALASMQADNLPAIVQTALAAAATRSKELAEGK
ncbi:MAG: pyrroline-5-carboxylate reductase [Mariprofundales bacterium]